MLYNNIGKNPSRSESERQLHMNIFKNRKTGVYLLALAAVVALYILLGTASGTDPAAYPYRTYLYQAQAWLDGQTTLDGESLAHLELAIYNGEYYVSFPPVPSVPMVLYTLIWGNNVPGGLFQKIYAAAACMLILSELMRRKKLNRRECILWAVFFCFASALLPVTLVGGVWYEAQILAFVFSTAAVVSMLRARPTLSCLMYALSVGCRPFTVCLGPILLMIYIENARRSNLSFKRGFAKLIPGLAAGLLIAAAYAFYNYIRFDNPLEFGHNHLPEFSFQGGTQFSVAHIAKNAKWAFSRLPFRLENGELFVEKFGSSMFISCPVFICWIIWVIKDLFTRRMTSAKWMIVIMWCLNVLLLLMHRTMGGMQFGARYMIELIPMVFAYFMLSPDRRKLTHWECMLMTAGLLINFAGACLVHV